MPMDAAVGGPFPTKTLSAKYVHPYFKLLASNSSVSRSLFLGIVHQIVDLGQK